MKFKVGDKVKLVFGSLNGDYFINTVDFNRGYTLIDLNGNLRLFYWDDFELMLSNQKDFEGELEFDIYE